VAHPRIVALFGIAGTVGLVLAPHGPGNYRGTAAYLERLDAQISKQTPIVSEQRSDAERAATVLLDSGRQEQIEAAVDHALKACGSGCSDLSTPLVMRNQELLRRVLVLADLDTKVETARRGATAPAAVNP
jgi:hypothetical protein